MPDTQARWQAKPKGFKTVRRKDPKTGKSWWYKPEDGGGSSGGGGGTTGAARRAANRKAANRIPPTQFTGSAGLAGPYANTPRLNPDLWEIAQNPKTSRWWARPADDLTGLDSWMRRDIKAHDRGTEAQVAHINEAYGNYANLAAQDAAAGAANLGTLAKAASAGYTDTTGGQATPVPGGMAPVAQSRAEIALPGILGQGAREASAAQSAQTIAALNQLPTVARSEGLGAGQTYRAGRDALRREALLGYRGQQQEAAAAESEARFQRQQLEATMRIALGEQANTRRGQDVTARGQDLDFTKAERDRAAELAKEAARLRQEAELARENNRLERWKTLTKRAEAKEKQAKEARKKRGANAKVREQADRLIDQMYRGLEDPDAPGGRISFTRDDMIDALVEEFDFAPSLAARYVSRGSNRAVGTWFD